MKKISRKGFLKVAAAAAMSGVTASALAACNAGSSSSTAASTGEAIYTFSAAGHPYSLSIAGNRTLIKLFYQDA